MHSTIEELFGSAKLLETSERELQKMLQARGILFGDGLLPTYAYAFVAGKDVCERWAASAERAVQAAEDVAHRLVEDVDLFDAMGLSRDGLELVRVDPGYKRICVLSRPDGIPVANGMKFVEINCDSPAMMMFLDIVGQCLLELPPFAKLDRPASASDRLLDTLLDCYREFGGKSTPTIAITDWEGQKTRYEHARLQEHFEARGCATVICDPRAFRRVDGELRAKDRKIDLVYRRALASELMDRAHEVEPLLTAYRDGTVCMVNPLRSYVASAKSVLTYLASTTASDCIPRSVLLDTTKARELIKTEPGKWVLKKSESHGGENVVLPSTSDSAWNAAMHSSESGMWIAQEYLQVPRITLPTLENGAVVASEKYYNWNPFVFGGTFAGGLVRVSSTPLINITLGGGLLPTFTK